jgi:hypothetical protein
VTAPADGYGSDRAFLAALKDRVKAQTAARGRTFAQIEREFLLQRFLARVFCDPDAGWVLKRRHRHACAHPRRPVQQGPRPVPHPARAVRRLRRAARRRGLVLPTELRAHSTLSETAWAPCSRGPSRRGHGTPDAGAGSSGTFAL